MKKFLLLSSAVVFAFSSAWAQERTVTGRVSALEDGSPLPGVNVVLKGTTTGTVTDADGKYSLNVPSNGGSIVFSFIGLQTQEIAIGDRTVVDVGLSLDVQQLSEVVVTGVGVATERKKIAIDVASVSGKDLVPTAIASIDQALQGKVAGAQVLLSSGEPGATANIQLRGINSLGNANPIILLDGVQVGTGNATSALAGLDMSNIERVEVVKGAAAGMLYGAQGANGVIQIFTKKGSRDKKVNVTLNTRYIVDQVVEGKEDLKASMHHYDTDASGFIVSSAGGRITPDPVTGTWSEPLVNLAPDTKNDNPYLEQTYDQLDQVYRQAATVNTSLNISGGSDKYDYSVNVARLDQENVRFGDLKRYNIGLNVGTEIVKNFTLRSTTQYVVENENLQSGNRFALVNSYPWVDFNARYANGYLVIKPKAENEFNPLSELEWRTRGSKNNRILQNFNLNYKFPKFFELDYKYGLQLWSTNYDDIIRSQKGFLQPADAYWGPGPGTGQVILTNDKSTYQNSLLTALARFDFKNDFNINVPLVATTQLTYDWRKDEYSRIRGQATNFPYPPYNLNNGGSKNTSSYSEEFITYGYLVNQTFEYGDIAGLSVGFRADYSSEFGFDAGGVKPFTFPRGTFFFNPSELFTSELIGNWKLRAAYGEAGVQPGRYARQVVLGSATYGDSQGLFNPSTAKNPSLKVQRNKELEIGTDLTLTPSISDSWLSKVVFGFTYWDRKGEDIIQPANLPPSSGAGTIIDNLISLSSNGIEFNLDIDAYKSDNFKWNLGLRYATAETIVDKISQGLEVPYGENGTFLIREGAPLGIFIGQVPVRRLDEKRPDGTFYIDEADRDDFQVVSTQYGDIVVEKATKIAMLTGSDDKRVMGNPQPDFFGSIINDFTIFKNLQVNMQWDFSYGNEIYNQTRQWLYRDRLSKDFDLPVSIDGESGAFVTMYNSIYNSVQPTGWFVEDGSFMRLRSLSFTYNLAGAIKAKWAKQLSITAAGRNLVTFTKYRGIDPESTSTGNTTDDGLSTGNSTGPARGIDSFNFPNLKSYQVGLTIGF